MNYELSIASLKHDISSLDSIERTLSDWYTFAIANKDVEQAFAILITTASLLKKYSYESNLIKVYMETFEFSFSEMDINNEYNAQATFIDDIIKNGKRLIEELLEEEAQLKQDISEEKKEFIHKLLLFLSKQLGFKSNHFKCVNAKVVWDGNSGDPTIQEKSVLDIVIKHVWNTYSFQYRFTPRHVKELEKWEKKIAMMEEIKWREEREYYDNMDREPDPCSACDSSPCICSDPDPG